MSNSIDAPMSGKDDMKSQGSGGNQVRSLISVNDLTYVLEPDLSCAVNRTHKRHFFQSNVYKNSQNAICILNSGADYIDPRRSFLEFQVSLPDNFAVGYFGRCGSVCNLIKQITISTRSGDEISRIADYAHFMNMMLPYQFDEEWFTQHGEMMAYNGCVYGDEVEIIKSQHVRSYHDAVNSRAGFEMFHTHGHNHVTTETVCDGEDCEEQVRLAPIETNFSAGDAVPNFMGSVQAHETYSTRRFCIPIYLLSPFFQYNRLLPAMIMSGLRIEIEWNNQDRAFVHCLQKQSDNAVYEYDETLNMVKYIGGSLPAATDNPVPNIALDEHDAGFELAHMPISQIPDGSRQSLFVSPQANSISGYTVVKPVFNMCSVQLSDAVQRALNELSAVNGLEIVYCDYEKTEAHLGSQSNSSTSAYIEVRKSCSRALKAYARVYDTSREKTTDDCFRGDDFPILEYQWQLGSLYFPNQSVKTEVETCNSAYSVAPLAYTYFLDAIDKYHPQSRSAYGPYCTTDDVRTKKMLKHADIFGPYENTHRQPNSLLEGIGTNIYYWDPETQQVELDATPNIGHRANYLEAAYKDSTDMHFGEIGTYARDQHVIGVSLERSTLFNLAGVPVNNSRVLALRMRLWQPTPGNSIKSVIQQQLDHVDNRLAFRTVKVGESEEDGGPVEGATQVARGRKCFIYLKFVKLARVFLNNVEVEHLTKAVSPTDVRNFAWNATLLRKLNVNTIIISDVLQRLQSDDYEPKSKKQKVQFEGITYKEQDF